MPSFFKKLEKVKVVYDWTYKIMLFICKLLLIGDIIITSGVTSVTATKGASSPYCIGATNCGTVTIGGVTGAITTSPYTYPALP